MKVLTVFWIALLGVSIFISGCYKEPEQADALSAKIDSECTIFFNREAIGENPDAVISFLRGNYNGAEVCVTGNLKQVTKEWIVLETVSRSKIWIPRDVVLFVKTD